MASKPKRPKKTAEEVALENRQRTMLDKEIEDEEEALKALARGTLGRSSLLSGAPKTRAQARSRGGSMLGGRGTGAAGGYGSSFTGSSASGRTGGASTSSTSSSPTR